MGKNASAGKKTITPGKVIGIFFLLYIAALTVPYVPHKKVNSAFIKQFSTRSFTSDSAGPERVSYITKNLDALLYRLKMIEEAEEEIVYSTFDFNCDESGKDMMAALMHAADRGIKVRVIVDGFSGFLDMRGNPYFLALAAHENIELKRCNPINFFKPWKIQARLHDKYLIIDDSMYLLGGRNTMDLFLGEYSDERNEDRELFVYETEAGNTPSLSRLREYFESVWALNDSKPFLCKKETKKVRECTLDLKQRYETLPVSYPSMTQDWDWESLTMETNSIALLNNPIEAGNKEPHMWYALSELMKTGKNIKIYTPYIICGKEMYRDLAEISSVCESVEILTNDVSGGANPWGCTDYLNQKERIWATGVQVYEFLGTHSSHTKALLIDERISVLGSYNLDMRSTYLDTELMLVVDSPKLNAIIQEEFAHDKTYSRTMTPTGEYAVGENYHPRELSAGKKVFYVLLRVLTVPIRRFL